MRHGDDQWADIVRWTFFALVAAEELRRHRRQHRGDGGAPRIPTIRRLLGAEGDLGAMFGLDDGLGQARDQGRRQLRRDLRRNLGEETPLDSPAASTPSGPTAA